MSRNAVNKMTNSKFELRPGGVGGGGIPGDGDGYARRQPQVSRTGTGILYRHRAPVFMYIKRIWKFFRIFLEKFFRKKIKFRN